MQKLLKIYKMVTILKIEKTCDTHVFRTSLGNNPDFALLPQASKKKCHYCNKIFCIGEGDTRENCLFDSQSKTFFTVSWRIGTRHYITSDLMIQMATTGNM